LLAYFRVFDEKSGANGAESSVSGRKKLVSGIPGRPGRALPAFVI
jgi:hypothetical protein